MGLYKRREKKKTQMGESIKGDECREHFRNILKGWEERSIGEKRIIVMAQDDTERY